MVKRCFDLLVSLVGLFLLLPFLLVVAALIKLDSPGPAFYKGNRIGKDGVLFGMFKFRTMVFEADRMGPALTQGGDPRVTRLGRILRKWKVDEIPQLINVVRGEMSIVGPRPESPYYVAYYTPGQRQVLQVRPGITGPTQVRYRHEEILLSRCAEPEKEYIERIMPQKLGIDLRYVEDRSFALDLKLLVDTFLCLFARDEPLLLQEEQSGSSGLQDV